MRKEFNSTTKQIIAQRAGYQCSYPGCTCGTIGPASDTKKAVNVGEACHICAASAGGPRYDPNMTEEQCVSPENGIWMCRTHAAEIDRDTRRYTVDVLKKWKEEAEERANKNRTNHMNINSSRMKYYIELFLPVISIALAYPLYNGIIKEILFLRFLVTIDIVLVLILLAYLLINFTYTKYVKKSVPIYSKKILLVGAFLAVMLILCLLIGVFLEINNVPKTRIETDIVIADETGAKHEKELYALYGCVLDDGRHCTEMSVTNDDLVPIFMFDITNGKKEAVLINDYDAVVVDLLEFIPYEDLNIIQHSGGADGWKQTIAFRLDMSPELGRQAATPLIEGNEKEISGDMISLSENEVKRLKLKIYPEEKGFYRFKVIVNYKQGGEYKCYETEEYNYVCTKGLNDLKYSRDEVTLEQLNEDSID